MESLVAADLSREDANRKGDYPVQTFDFLGYEFRPRTAVWRGGKLGVSFLPAASLTWPIGGGVSDFGSSK